MKTRTENWRGHSIRFVEIDGNWWAVLKDICDALNLSTWESPKGLNRICSRRSMLNLCQIDLHPIKIRPQFK